MKEVKNKNKCRKHLKRYTDNLIKSVGMDGIVTPEIASNVISDTFNNMQTASIEEAKITLAAVDMIFDSIYAVHYDMAHEKFECTCSKFIEKLNEHFTGVMECYFFPLPSFFEQMMYVTENKARKKFEGTTDIDELSRKCREMTDYIKVLMKLTEADLVLGGVHKLFKNNNDVHLAKCVNGLDMYNKKCVLIADRTFSDFRKTITEESELPGKPENIITALFDKNSKKAQKMSTEYDYYSDDSETFIQLKFIAKALSDADLVSVWEEAGCDKKEVHKTISKTMEDLPGHFLRPPYSILAKSIVYTAFRVYIDNTYNKDMVRSFLKDFDSAVIQTYKAFRWAAPIKEEDKNDVYNLEDYKWTEQYLSEMKENIFKALKKKEGDKLTRSFDEWDEAFRQSNTDVSCNVRDMTSLNDFFMEEHDDEPDFPAEIASNLTNAFYTTCRLYSTDSFGRFRPAVLNEDNTIMFSSFYSNFKDVYKTINVFNASFAEDVSPVAWGFSGVNGDAEAVEGLDDDELSIPEIEEDTPYFTEEIKTPRTIKEELDKSVIGQERAKKIISVGIYNHYKRIRNGSENIKKSNILMVGPTGCGKTEIARTVARVLDVPFAIADATGITSAGYVGEDAESVVMRLISACGGNIAAAEKGIIYIDEIDKISRSGRQGDKDVGGEGAQQALLKIIEGTDLEITVKKGIEAKKVRINTSNILFICGGAFEGITMKEKSNKMSLGFNSVTEEEETEIDSKALIKAGMLPELVGRFPIIARLDALTTSDLKKILTEPENSIVGQYKDLLKLDNVTLTFSDNALKWVADKAYSMKTGARGLKTVIEDSMLDLMYEIPDEKDVETVSIELDGDRLKAVKNKGKSAKKAGKKQAKTATTCSG